MSTLAGLPVRMAGLSSRVLLVENDFDFRGLVADALRDAGFRVGEAANGAQGMRHFLREAADLVLVNLDLPDLCGLEFLRKARRIRDMAVILVSASRAPQDRIRGLECGADDFLSKPLDVGEVLARVRAVLRRYQAGVPAGQGAAPVIELGGWVFDLVRRELADPSGRVLPLTRGEFDLLAALALTSATPLCREYLLEVVASAESTTNPRMIDVMVSKLRQKLAQAAQPAPGILTVQGFGYRFLAPHAPV